MNKVRICVLVSGGGTNLQALINSQSKGDITHGEIVGVISSNPDAYALVRAEKAGIPSAVCIKKGRSQEEFEDELISLLDSFRAEIIVLAGFLTILSSRFTNTYNRRIINIHPSLIPSFCGEGFYGLKVHEAALERGVKLTGATVHFVNEIPDGGEIIAQKAVEVLPGDTPQLLQKRVMEQAEWILLPQAVELVCERMIDK